MKSNKIINFDSVERYSPDYKYGLSDPQVESRRQNKLSNKTKSLQRKSNREIIFDNLFSLFNVVLYVVAGLIIFFENYFYLFFLILLICNSGLVLYEDLKVKQTARKESNSNQTKITVVRNGKEVETNPDDVVLDDIIVFSQGQQICVDGIILNGNLTLDESPINGESHASFKQIGDEIYSGSFVLSGKAYVKADKVGELRYEEITKEKSQNLKKTPTVVISTLRKLFRALTIALAIITGLTLLTYGLRSGTSFSESYKTAFSSLTEILILVIPSGLFLLTSISFAISVVNLSSKNVQTNDFCTLEMASKISILCLDKTGTITEGKLKFKSLEIFDESIKEEQVKQIISNLLIATGDNDITAQALKEYFNYGLTMNVSKSLPFNSDNKYSAASFKAGNTYVLGEAEYLNLENKQSVLRKASEYTEKGFVVLVLGKTSKEIKDERFNELVTAIGFVILMDGIKKGVQDTLKWCKENEIAVKIISGDNEKKTSEIAKQIGLGNADRFISLEGMDIEEVKAIADKYTIFGKASPEQKEAIIASLQEQGKTVGMIGDGINDVLALKKADCSIAMASGSKDSKNVSQIVLLDSNLERIPELAKEGKCLVNNINKISSLYLTKSIFVILVALIFNLISLFSNNNTFVYPFKITNFYVLEFVTIGVASILIMLQRNLEDPKDSLIKGILKKAIPAAFVCTLATLIPFILSLLEKQNLFYLDLGSFEKIKGVAVISFTLFGLIFLGKICYPFSKQRLIVLIVAIIGNLGLLLYAMLMTISGNESASFINIAFDQLTPLNYFTALVIVSILGILYVGITQVISVIRKEKDNENI